VQRRLLVGPDVDGLLTVLLHGELDFSNTGEFAAVIRAALEEHRPRAVCIDLSAVTFLDSSGIGLLVQAMWAAEAVPARFQVRDPQPLVLDQLRLSGLLEPFGLTG
jgi:anti-anti-sigma factor